MRPRTAAGIAVGFIAVKALLTYVAIRALSERRWVASPNWHAQLGTVGEWLAAGAAFVAAGVALVVAGREGRTRKRERRAAEHAQARLVDVEIQQSAYSPDFGVTIRNYGDRPIIRVGVLVARWTTRPDVTWRRNPDYTNNDIIRILQPEPQREGRGAATLYIQFLDGDGNLVPKVLRQDPIYRDDIEYEEISGEPEVEIRFVDANGNHWRTGTSLDATRM